MIGRFFSLALWGGLLAGAALATPDWVATLDSGKPGAHPAMRGIEADYRISWKGMLEAGGVTMVFDEVNGRAQASGGSRGMASKLFPYDFNFKGRFSSRTLRPKSFHSWEKNKKDVTILSAAWKGKRVSSQEVIRPHWVPDEFRRDHRFEFEPMRDLFTGMLFVRSQPLLLDERHRFVIYPQKGAYLIDTRVVGRELKLGRPAIRLELGMRRIGDDLALRPYEKLKKATLWLADDRDRLLLELRAKVFIGDVRMSLTGARAL